MKRLLLIPILVAVLFSSCQEEVWRDHENPQIYFPQSTIEGVVFSTAWMYDTDEYTIPFGVYLSGVRPENQNSDITVTFSVDETLVDDYNSDVENFYEGRMELMPSTAYSVGDNTVTIPTGEVSGTIPITVFTDEVENLPLLNGNGDTIVYVIPLVLTGSNKYDLHSESEKRVAFTTVILDQPRFYFWANRDGTNPVSRRVVDINDPVTESFLISSYGVTNDDDYVLTIAVDETHPLVPAGVDFLPAEAYEILSNTVTIEEGDYTTELPVRIINSEIPEYSVSYTSSPWNSPKFYYLPIVIESASRYGADEEKGLLLLRVSLKNDYEFNYNSEIKRVNMSTGLTYANSYLMSPTSLDVNVLRMAHVSVWSSGFFLNPNYPQYTGFYALEIIPNPADNTRWGLSASTITNEGAQNTKAGWEFDEVNSYYNWSMESFFLFYKVNNHQNSEIWDVTEILEAQL